MKQNVSNGVRIGVAALLAAAWQFSGSTARAQQAPPAAAPASANNAVTTPAMSGPLVANPNPAGIDADGMGKIYFNGAVSGLALVQSDPFAGDHNRIDVSNALFSMQNSAGPLQFFVQAGDYAFPALGAPYLQSWKATGDLFGLVPVAYAKLVANDAFSVEVGKLPTLIGAEYGFSFQNMNIERGLLWNQEPIVSRGIQANYTRGPLALSVSLNDGFYSDSYNWLSAAATWTIDKANTVVVAGGGNFGHTDKNILKSPYFYNNSDILDIIYTWSNAPWTITPYFQYTHVPGSSFFGTPHANDTIGGAVLASYALSDNVSLAGRFEAIGATGDALSPNLLYGPASSAISFTLTPTWQRGIYFVRGEASVVQAFDTASGAAFGKSGTAETQARLVLEAGVVF